MIGANWPRVWHVLIFVVPVTLLAFVRAGLYRAVIVISSCHQGNGGQHHDFRCHDDRQSGAWSPDSAFGSILLRCFCLRYRRDEFAVRGITHSLSTKPRKMS